MTHLKIYRRYIPEGTSKNTHRIEHLKNGGNSKRNTKNGFKWLINYWNDNNFSQNNRKPDKKIEMWQKFNGQFWVIKINEL